MDLNRLRYPSPIFTFPGEVERYRAELAARELRGSENRLAWEHDRVRDARPKEVRVEEWKDDLGRLQRVVAEAKSNMSEEQIRKELLFAEAQTDEERMAILKSFTCSPQPSDSPADTQLRSKWAKLFDEASSRHTSYSDIEKSIKRDVEAMKKKEREARDDLNDLLSAQVASRKQKEEAEEKRRREGRRECEACGKVVEGEEELVCERCWERSGGKGKGGFWHWQCGRGSHNQGGIRSLLWSQPSEFRLTHAAAYMRRILGCREYVSVPKSEKI